MTDQTSTTSDLSGPSPDLSSPGGSGTKPPRRRLLRTIILALLLIVVCGIGVVIWLLRTPPAHWARHQAFLNSTSPQEIKAIAKRVDDRIDALIGLAEALEEADDSDGQASALERMLTSEGEQPSDDGQATAGSADQGASPGGAADGSGAASAAAPKAAKPLIKKIHMSPEEANVWITEKLDEWLHYRDYEMPDQVADPMIAIEDDQLLLSFAFETSGFSQIFTAGFDLTFLENGNALLELRDVKAGQLPLPADGIGNYIRSKAPDNPAAERVADWLDKLEGVEFKPSMKLGKKHKFWVIDYAVAEDGIDLTVKVQKRPTLAARRKPKPTQVATVAE